MVDEAAQLPPPSPILPPSGLADIEHRVAPVLSHVDLTQDPGQPADPRPIYVTEEQQRPSSLVGDNILEEWRGAVKLVGGRYIAAEQRGAATSTWTLVGDHYVAEEQQTCCICDHERRGGHRTVYKPLSTSTPLVGYCSDVISASQVEQLMDSLQHIVATDDDDDEVQLVNLAVQQRRGRRRRQDSPSYADLALEHRTDCQTR